MASSTPGDIPPLVAAGSVGRAVGTPGGAGGAMASPEFGRKRSGSIKRPSTSSSPSTFTDLPTIQTQNSKKKSKVNLIGFTKHNRSNLEGAIEEFWGFMAFSSHFCNLVFGCFWQRIYQNVA